MAKITDILFISTDYIKNNSEIPVPVTLDDAYLTNSILMAQNENVQRVIGTPLYTTVVDQDLAYISGSIPMGPDYDNLLTTFLKPLTMYYALYRAINTMEYKVMNTSIVVKNDSANSRTISEPEINELKRITMKNVEWWTDQTIRFITTQNSKYSKFPEWTSFSADTDTILPMRGRGYAQTGLYLGKRSKSKWYYGPGNSYDFGTTGYGSNENKGTGDNNCCY